MSEERTRVLEMLAEGKITAEEANQMIKELTKTSSRAARSPGQSPWRWLGEVVSAWGSKAEWAQTLDWTLDGAGLSAIDAQTSNGSISLRGSDQDQVTVRAWKKVRAPTEAAAQEFARQVQIHVERQGDAVRIYKEHPTPPPGTSVAARYEILAPRTVGVNLRSANGAIRIREMDGAVEASTSNGAIELQGGAGKVNLCTANGAIRLQDAAGRIRAETTNGRVEASVRRLVEGDFTTCNGAITVQIREGSAPVTAKTTNGAIRLTLPADFSGQLEAKTSLGRVHCALPVAVTQETKNRLAGRIGAGGEAMVKLRAWSGSVHLSAQPQRLSRV